MEELGIRLGGMYNEREVVLEWGVEVLLKENDVVVREGVVRIEVNREVRDWIKGMRRRSEIGFEFLERLVGRGM